MSYYLVEAETLEDLENGFYAIVNGGNPIKKSGHWIWTGKERPAAPESIRCSVCGFWYVRLKPRFYCSNCGAKMDNAERTYKNE